jgi:hypothetical protein
MTQSGSSKITLRAFLIGAFFAAVFAYITAYRDIATGQQMTTSQIAPLVCMLLVALVFLVNPLLRRIKFIRPLAAAELLIIFLMGAVSSGVGTYGLTAQLLPLMGGLFNQNWNTDQSRWDLYVEPFVNDKFFVAEEGVQVAAMKLYEAETDWRKDSDVLRAAQNFLKAREKIDALQEELRALGDVALTDVALKRAGVQARLDDGGVMFRRAEAGWAMYEDDFSPDVVARDWTDRVAAKEKLRSEAKASLEILEEKSFATVELFRRGLPEGMRAIPGFIPVPKEGASEYFVRLRRLTHGIRALKSLRSASALVDRGGTPADHEEIVRHLDLAIEQLTPIATAPRTKARFLRDQAESTARGKVSKTKSLLAERVERQSQTADAEDAKILKKRVAKLRAEANKLSAKNDKLTLVRVGLKKTLDQAEKVLATQEVLRDIRTQMNEAEAIDLVVVGRELHQAELSFRGFDASYRRYIAGDVNWRVWISPLANWALIIGLTYLVFMSLNVLIFRQWAYNEKLIYPFAEFPEILSGVSEEGIQTTPPIYRSGLFWSGFAISFLILLWNWNDKANLHPIRMHWYWDEHIKNSVFDGLRGAGLHDFLFTLIGLSFLVPARISLSLWSFHLLFFVQLLVLVWLGYGVDYHSFPRDWGQVLNFRTAQGGGALLVFSSVLLWKCRQYIFCAFSSRAIDMLEPDEKAELKLSSWLFMMGSIALVAVLTWSMGANLFYTIFFYLVCLAVTVGMIRAVTEGGVLSFQSHFGPMHLIRSIFGFDHTWTAPALFAPLMVYYSVFFLDLKAFIAPAMANALKIRDTLRIERRAFHLSLAGSLICAIVVAFLTQIIYCYHIGADATAHPWIYKGYAGSVFTPLKTIAQTQPIDMTAGKWWLLTGALMMGAMLYARQYIFWIPHPIGLIMFVSPLMRAYWSSILIGWLFKVMITKYGDNNTYRQWRFFFIGLMIGELLLCAMSLAHLERGY